MQPARSDLTPQPSTDPDRIHWHEIVAEGIEARRHHDGAQWRLGDLALEVETTYGGEDLRKYAVEIGIGHSALQEYRRIAGAYEKSTRVDNLTWTHHRVVSKFSQRSDLLKQAQENKWSSRELLASIASQHTGGSAKLRDALKEQRQAITDDDQDRLKALVSDDGPFNERHQRMPVLAEVLRQASDVASDEDGKKGGWFFQANGEFLESARLLDRAGPGIRHIRPEGGFRITCSVEGCERNAEKQHSLWKDWECEQGHTIWMRVCEFHSRASKKAKKAGEPMPSWARCHQCEREAAKTDEERAYEAEIRERNLQSRRMDQLRMDWASYCGDLYDHFQKDDPPREAAIALAKQIDRYAEHIRTSDSPSYHKPEDFDDFFPTLKRFAQWLTFVCEAAEKVEAQT
jgi:hypothetical protein